MKSIIKSAILFSLLIAFTACSSDDDVNNLDASVSAGSLDITFNNMVGDEDFQLDKEYSVNGEDVSLSQVRYWISNIKLINDDGESIEIPESYFLIEETGAISIQDGAYEYPAKNRDVINIASVPGGTYTDIEFSVGVDQVYNDNLSLQAGELSQLNGMTNISWMWHTSYIFASIKGNKAGNDNNLVFETGLNDNYKTVTIDLEDALQIDGTSTGKIQLKADIAAILDGIDIEETPVIGAATPEAMELMATNFETKVFTWMSLSNE
ncbi:MbnP family protein [Zunongwangia endophytica]|uniref:MbnP family protein n=1 Tax=Zunongwangia endophytica TaxID=1808945 RepID=A0ABV8HFH1_9FLAO|nr:MbnP family protein [Zunongwangia endophytica]MDN3596665.1 hypothetical protein [Zunongwangia endophytica]